MNKLKVFTVLGTRPEIIRLSEIINKFDIFFDHKIIHTGQNPDYELNEIFFKDLGIRKPDFFLNSNKSNPISTISNILEKINILIKKNKPDAFFILGDTNSSLSSYAAKRNKIPIFHYEAGNRCFDQLVPEEINRKIVDHIADINLTYSDISRSYLINEGIPPDRVIKVGSPMLEIIRKNEKKINKSLILKKLKINKNKYILLSIHREENLDYKNNLDIILDCIEYLSKKYTLILSLHPRTKNKLEKMNFKFNANVIISKPFNFTDYIFLQKNSFCVISDSGTINEEASILGFDAINFRDSHERPESTEEGSTFFIGINKTALIQTINIIMLNKIKKNKLKTKVVYDYNVTNASDKIVKIIQSYTTFVNKKIWKK